MVLIDTLGMVCPLPLMQLQQRLEPLSVGTEVMLLADDPSSVDDVPFWCQQTGHQLISIETNSLQQFEIRLVKIATKSS